MNRINYKVVCKTSKLKNNIKRNDKYILNRLSRVIYKRREIACYEKSISN